MGGRGSASGASVSVFGKLKPKTIETKRYPSGAYGDTVLRAINKGDGNVELVYDRPDSYSKQSKSSKITYVTYNLDHGFVNGTPHNLNFDKIKSFEGKTYFVKEVLKNMGYKFRNGKWVKT